MRLPVGKIGRLGFIPVFLVIVNVLLIGVLNIGGSAATSALGPTGDNIVYAAIFVLLTLKAVVALVRETRRETRGLAAGLARKPDEARRAPEAVELVAFWRRLPVVTLAIIGVTSIISLLALDMFYPYPREVPLFSALYFSPPLVLTGQLWRLLTVTLVHGSSIHLAFNMAALWWLGISEGGEARLGRLAFLFTYLVSAVGASLASLAFTNQPAVGASGAIMGILGVLAVRTALDLGILRELRSRTIVDLRVTAMLSATQHTLVRRLEAFALIGVATLASGPLLGVTGLAVDNSAHAGGMATGIVIGLVLGWRYLRREGRTFSLVFAGDNLVRIVDTPFDDEDEDQDPGVAPALQTT